jgi:hypothetical protein
MSRRKYYSGRPTAHDDDSNRSLSVPPAQRETGQTGSYRRKTVTLATLIVIMAPRWRSQIGLLRGSRMGGHWTVKGVTERLGRGDVRGTHQMARRREDGSRWSLLQRERSLGVNLREGV